MVNPREATSFPGRIMNEIVGVVLKNDAACDTVPGKFRCIIAQRDCARKWVARFVVPIPEPAVPSWRQQPF
jgi:hypothetical protein